MPKYIFFFLLFVGIHYMESLPPIAGLSVAQLWKIPVILCLLVHFMLSGRRKSSFEIWGMLVFGEAFLCPEMWTAPLGVLLYATKNLLCLLFFNYWMSAKPVADTRRLEAVLYSLAQFVCLSSVPVLLGIIDPPFIPKTTDTFGDEMTYYRGIFGSPHAASSYFCISVIVLVAGFQHHRFQSLRSRLYNAALIAVGLVSIFNAYVRTGWLMLLVGAFVLMDFARLTARKAATYLLAITVSASGLLYLYEHNEAFYGRITGRNVYTGRGGDNIDTEGSGRSIFWKNGLRVWNQSGIYEHLFGSGVSAVHKENKRTTGMAVFSHSQYIDALAQYGLFGLLFLLLYYLAIYRLIRRCRRSPYHRLALALFWASVIFCTFQNELYFVYAMMFAAVLALCQRSRTFPLPPPPSGAGISAPPTPSSLNTRLLKL